MSKFGFSFSWKRLFGIAKIKQKFARKTGIPTSKSGLERKIGGLIFKLIKSMCSYNNSRKNNNRKKK